ncbi:unnamed protein product [Gordionus sp. m RMFG-2023]|uniref:uracil-DNA glycosylase-like n=1 Tax=Gordionus sp. m RMFG-2023 TaxID=3053472 RepID=UPI0030E558F3
MPGQCKITNFVDNPNKRKFSPKPPENNCSEIININLQKAEMKRAKTLGFKLGWYKALKSEFNSTYYLKLINFIQEERLKNIVFPLESDVFSWANIFDIEQTKVVILGQDPYHNPKQAHGLCFSVLPYVQPPPSLINIYKELKTDIDGFTPPSHGYLKGWADQGVLLLNSVLTVRANEANSHRDKGWETFTDAVINHLNINLTRLVFILWGSYAQKKCQKIDDKKHLILKSAHPSPLSAHRGFFGCKHFSKTNEYLKSINKIEIDWSHLPLD